MFAVQSPPTANSDSLMPGAPKHQGLVRTSPGLKAVRVPNTGRHVVMAAAVTAATDVAMRIGKHHQSHDTRNRSANDIPIGLPRRSQNHLSVCASDAGDIRMPPVAAINSERTHQPSNQGAVSLGKGNRFSPLRLNDLARNGQFSNTSSSSQSGSSSVWREARSPFSTSASPSTQENSSVEMLFDTLKRETFSLRSMPPDLAGALKSHLDTIQGEDLGVSCEDVRRIPRVPGIAYQEVYSGPKLTLCIFLLRAGARLPLHDHPDMHVFGRLLFGRIRVVSFDPCDTQYASNPRPPGSRWASLHSDTIIGPTPVTYSLGPDEGNIHELHALEDSAFFDVLTPPYNSSENRDCTYYSCEQVGTAPNGAPLCVLSQTHPRNFGMVTQPYKGPEFLM